MRSGRSASTLRIKRSASCSHAGPKGGSGGGVSSARSPSRQLSSIPLPAISAALGPTKGSKGAQSLAPNSAEAPSPSRSPSGETSATNTRSGSCRVNTAAEVRGASRSPNRVHASASTPMPTPIQRRRGPTRAPTRGASGNRPAAASSTSAPSWASRLAGRTTASTPGVSHASAWAPRRTLVEAGQRAASRRTSSAAATARTRTRATLSRVSVGSWLSAQVASVCPPPSSSTTSAASVARARGVRARATWVKPGHSTVNSAASGASKIASPKYAPTEARLSSSRPRGCGIRNTAHSNQTPCSTPSSAPSNSAPRAAARARARGPGVAAGAPSGIPPPSLRRRTGG